MIKQAFWGVAALLAVAGCSTKHQVDMTHEVKPIHITMDINLKVERELDQFFGQADQASTMIADGAE